MPALELGWEPTLWQGDMFSEGSSRRFLRGHQPKNQLVCHDTPPPHLTNRNCSALVLIRKDNRISMRGLKLAVFFYLWRYNHVHKFLQEVFHILSLQQISQGLLHSHDTFKKFWIKSKINWRLHSYISTKMNFKLFDLLSGIKHLPIIFIHLLILSYYIILYKM